MLFQITGLFSQNSNYFVENVGQISDIETKQNIPQINYFLNTHNALITFWKNKISFLFKKNVSDSIQWDRIDLVFLNCNENIKIKSLNQSDYSEIINKGNNTNKKARSYKELLYSNIYNNIDLKILTTNNSFKYEFIIHPNGNINDIQMRYAYAKKPSVKNNDKLLIENNRVSFEDEKPVAFQSNDSVLCRWEINKNGNVGFSVEKYDNKKI